MRQGDDGRDDRVALAIMAKAPRAGEVKTRLTPPLPAEDAAALYHAFLRDKIEQVRALARVRPAIVFAPAAAEPFFRALAPDFSLVPQRGADLGERITAAFDDLLDAGAPAALIDSDTPDLPGEFFEEAIERLADPETDVLVGPSDDGGYYLIGLRVARPALFSDMPWSTPA